MVREGSVVVKDKENNFAYFKGRNIFNLDLKLEERSIAARYPSYRKIRLTRFLPNQLCIDFSRRLPLAAIKGSKPLLVDENLVVFNAVGQPEEVHLPLIFGLDKKMSVMTAGRRYNIPELFWAVRFIKESKGNNKLKSNGIDRIDVANINEILIFLSCGVQAKINREDFSEKVEILGDLIAQVGSSLDNIEYIDLRFKEPVIKFKEPNGKKFN
jgi:cell division septal protein FtsQ